MRSLEAAGRVRYFALRLARVFAWQGKLIVI
jgi:hypothetical protein